MDQLPEQWREMMITKPIDTQQIDSLGFSPLITSKVKQIIYRQTLGQELKPGERDVLKIVDNLISSMV